MVSLISINTSSFVELISINTSHSSEDAEFFQEVQRAVQAMPDERPREKAKGDRKLLFSRSVQNSSKEIGDRVQEELVYLI